MKPRKITRRAILSATDQIGEQDGTDPRLDRPAAPQPVKNRKALQLCRQVADTLGAVLAGECADDLLRDLFVASVEPHPTAVRLLVTLTPAPSAGPFDPAEVLGRLDAVAGRLRAEVASAIHRRKAPELLFRLRLG